MIHGRRTAPTPVRLVSFGVSKSAEESAGWVINRKEPFRTLFGYHSEGALPNLVWLSFGRNPSEPYLVIIRKEPFRTLLGYHSEGALPNLIWLSFGRSPSEPCLVIIRKEHFRTFSGYHSEGALPNLTWSSFGRSPSEPYLVIIRKEPFVRLSFGRSPSEPYLVILRKEPLPNLIWLSFGRSTSEHFLAIIRKEPFRTFFGYLSEGSLPNLTWSSFGSSPSEPYLAIIRNRGAGVSGFEDSGVKYIICCCNDGLERIILALKPLSSPHSWQDVVLGLTQAYTAKRSGEVRARWDLQTRRFVRRALTGPRTKKGPRHT